MGFFIYKCKLFLRHQRQKFYYFNSIKKRIVRAEEIGEKIALVHSESEVPVFFPKIYEIAPQNMILCNLPDLYLMKYANAIMYPFSDMILMEDGIVLHKYFHPLYSATTLQDVNVYKEKNGTLYMEKPRHVIHIKNGFSLCGVYNYVWSHFLVCYLPKLYWLIENSNLFKDEITLVIPRFKDPHIRRVIQLCVEKSRFIQIKELKSGESAQCDTLYHIDNTTFFAEIMHGGMPNTMVFPPDVYGLLYRNLLSSTATKNTKNPLKEKIFLERKGGRNLLNYEEVRTYFQKKGYTFISPHLLSFEEKVEVFTSASVVVGPGSSAFSNLFFSKAGTKVLSFINIKRSFESYLGFVAKYRSLDMLLLTGTDKDFDDMNSSYYISLERIESACKELNI
jgi:hypothetical protein